MLGRGAIAIVDSPGAPRIDPTRERTIDSALRAIVARMNAQATRQNRVVLAMFPTPTRQTFAEFAAARDCKPHLRDFARALFGRRSKGDFAPAFGAGGDAGRHSGGQIFTRFMIAGFSTHGALKCLGIDAFEGYPYLAFCLWKRPGTRLPPKHERGALAARMKILNRMLPPSSRRISARPFTIDQVDATALAMSTVAVHSGGQLLSISHPAEGRLIVALPPSFAKPTHM